MEEIWRDISGYSGIYKVSNLGRVKRLPSLLKSGKMREERIVTLSKNTSGYFTALLYANGKENRQLIHRIVAKEFLEAVDGKNEVNHLDEDKANNALNNLEWCNRKENVNYGTANARRSKHLAAISPDGVIKKFKSVSEASTTLGISQPQISQVLHNKRKTAHGHKFVFA